MVLISLNIFASLANSKIFEYENTFDISFIKRQNDIGDKWYS
jgi:hypothetical protein